MQMRIGILIGLCCLFFWCRLASAQVDTLTTVVNATNTTGGVNPPVPPLGAFGYDSHHDQMYVAGFSSGNTNYQLRLISNVSNPAAQIVQTQIFATSWQRFLKNNDFNLTGGTPTVSGLLLNPQPIGSLPAYGAAWIVDGNTTVSQNGTSMPGITQRIYGYNLAQDTNADSRDEFTSLMTLTAMQSAAGTSNLNASVARQFVWSGDGQSLYFLDPGVVSTNVFAGVWKLPASGGPPVRIYNASSNSAPELNTEPAVITSGKVDKIYFRGGGATGNVGGIDFITHDGVTTGSRQIAVTAAALSDFWESPAGQTATIFSMTSDSDGNLYFCNSNANIGSTTPKGLFRLDPQGRLSKVVGYAERQAVFGGTPTANMLREQTRTAVYNNNNGVKPFDVTQIMYLESGSGAGATLNTIAGAYAFKPGDFSRDNVIDQKDVSLLKGALTLVGTQAPTSNLRYDLNGNGQVTWKDVKIFQQFYPFPNGDADMNGQITWADYLTLKNDFGQSGKIWTGADFTGDGLVNVLDFNIFARNFGITASGPTPTATDWNNLALAVPEPDSMIFAAALVMLGRMTLRRSQRLKI